MIKAINKTLFFSGVVFLLVNGVSYAANNPYGLTDYQYTQGLYNTERLKKNNECMQPFYDAYSQGKIKSYEDEKTNCFIASFEVIPKEDPTISTNNSSTNQAGSGRSYGDCMTACVGDISQYKGDYGLVSAKKNSCSTKCSAETNPRAACQQQCLATKYSDSPTHIRGAMCASECSNAGNQPATTANSESENKNARQSDYEQKYVQKCLGEYKNSDHPDIRSCCQEEAKKEASTMERRGVFDTSTTADLPIFIDDTKCKIQEHLTDEEKYIRECIRIGKNRAHGNGQEQRCRFDYFYESKRVGGGPVPPPKLERGDKYIEICLARGFYKEYNNVYESSDESEKISVCLADYYHFTSGYMKDCQQNEKNRFVFKKETYEFCKNKLLKEIEDAPINIEGQVEGSGQDSVTPARTDNPPTLTAKIRVKINSFLGSIFGR